MKIVIFIIIIVLSIVRAVNQNKNKAKRGRKPIQQKPVNDIWEELLGEKEVGDQEFPGEGLVAEDIGEVVPEETEKKEMTEEQYRFDPQKEGISDIPEVQEPLKVYVKKKKIRIDGEKFSARKAVIYNEILNRKYV